MRFETIAKHLSPTIKRIAYKLNGHYSAFNHDDLYQEALLHLWQEFQRGALADKTDSYILQGCYFHLKNYIRTHCDKARCVSLDGFKGEDEEGFDLGEILLLPERACAREEVHCRMLIEQIRNNGLTDREKNVFLLSLEGMTTREIGRRLGVSHVMVVKLKKSMRAKCLKHMEAR